MGRETNENAEEREQREMHIHIASGWETGMIPRFPALRPAHTHFKSSSKKLHLSSFGQVSDYCWHHLLATLGTDIHWAGIGLAASFS